LVCEISEFKITKMKIFFNSSMPRSGSTLLQNILGNNPDFYATPTSAVLDYLNASKKIYTNSLTVKAQDEEVMKKAFLMYSRFALEGYFLGLTQKKYVIDKSRGWALNMPYLKSFYPEPKIICMVRDLRDILVSMEKNHRKHPDKWDSSMDWERPSGITISDRIAMWMHPHSKPVGNTLYNLMEVFHRGDLDNFLFIRFEDLCQDPETEMRKVYEFLNLPYFHIDYNNIKQVTFEDDKFHGKYGDHKIKSKIEPLESKADEILGEHICSHLYEKYKWYFQNFKYE